MRIALIADIHGNRVALDAVLADLERAPADRLVCLGDVAEGGPQPVEAIARLRELDCPVVMGNCDGWLATLDPPDTERWRHDVGCWTRERLAARDLDFLLSFRPVVELDGLLCFHGSPRSFVDTILPTFTDEELAEALGGTGARVLAGGHVHVQWTRRAGESLYVNPGSIGQAQLPDRSGWAPRAEYAVVTIEERRLGVELRSVAYDAREVSRLCLERGMPHPEQTAARWSR